MVSTASGWRLRRAMDAAEAARLAEALGVSRLTASVLVARGVASEAEARRFLAPSLARDWPEKTAVPGLAEAAERVARALRRGEHVVVFGDFDLDGVSAAALLALALRDLGGNATPIVPHRFREGYGLTDAALERVLAERPDLVVTVDCGISAAEQVRTLRARGVDAVVTDHHEPGDLVPEGVPVADPKLADGGPELSGAGVALALARAVGELLGETDAWARFADLAAIGTVADVVPLTGPNRALVADGLAALRRAPRPGIRALAAVAGIEMSEITAERVAFGLAPRLNAAGRMADPALALRLLMTSDETEAEELARALDEHNRVRQSVEADVFEAALARLEALGGPTPPAIVVAGEDWHEGVRGIVASRLAERFGLPALVLCIEGDEAQGSGRSVPGVDLYGALARTGGLLTRFGGHEAAVGFALPADRIDDFRAAISQALADDVARLGPRVALVDAVARLSDVGLEAAAEITMLEPFGFGNPRPVFALPGVFLDRCRLAGSMGQHLMMDVHDGVARADAVMFRCPDPDALMAHEAAADVVAEIERSSWRGRDRVRLVVRGVHAHAPSPESPARELVDALFEGADASLDRAEYATIAEEPAFHTKLVGVTFEGRQEAVARLVPGTPLRIVREPDNPHDGSACALHDPSGTHVGYFNRRLAAALAPHIDAGAVYEVVVSEVTGDATRGAFGVNVLVRRADDDEQQAQAGDEAAAARARLKERSGEELLDGVIEAIAPGIVLHEAQREALAALERNERTLLVMATGRGKSLVFFAHAARRAVERSEASVFIYPLRSLVADQAYHLASTLARAGCTAAVLTGESGPAERDGVFGALADGSVDVVLTTPEFFERHAERFGATKRVRFAVVDEAHHVGAARRGHRPAYAQLSAAFEAAGVRDVLATTATADDGAAAAIEQALGVTRRVLDPTVRENLTLEDRRGVPDKRTALASLLADGEKSVVYVNSREEAVRLAQHLRRAAPRVRDAVAFYHGGLGRSMRHAVEEAFRDGSVRAVVATSAFGEGVNVPDVRRVVLYHMPFSAVEFNQLCGRAGRDGAPAAVHLLFCERDARINEAIVASLAPERDDLAALYLALRDRARDAGEDGIEATNAELAEAARRKRPTSRLDESGVSAGLAVFRELGLVRTSGIATYRRIELIDVGGVKVDLERSVRYAEGRQAVAEFGAFKQWVLSASAEELLTRINRPIVPSA
ncbi:single-stranded-DNA-specific exonuclease RecJ [Coriobacteriia bacterium Es71-Z0120]|uniref:single-stranded-DNA-specific exonuclease RecJ n=1 Tax=Parvivirga hydrogeniphila TaxID=2939460 RepID=UPI002260CF87|nr:single-stranded-DNA-specific exonuclease RecJ [Parvivirga hydrogeniphila]MCL4079192.1 single-stranded-DNA-specific exonuclease RecJ [Parvivirga hydrogeniphila]